MANFQKAQFFKNVGSSWASLAANVAIGVFLSPFILHHLGDSAYGIWVLIFSFTGYYGIFDLGIRSSVIRYVSRFTAARDGEQLSRMISTSFFAYTCIGAISMTVTLIVCVLMTRLFHIPAAYRSSARWLLLMSGGTVAIGFPLGIFGGILEGLQKFYISSWTNIANAVLRAILIVFFLSSGYGLVTAAIITVSLPLIAACVRAAFALRALPLSFKLAHVKWATFRELAGYSGTTFLIIIATKLRFQTDEIIIGSALSAAAITFFSIGARIVDYAVDLVATMAQIFVPMSSQSEAAGDMNRLRKILVGGNRACAFTILPISLILIFLGKSVIEVWVGSRYIAQSYPVLLILLIPVTIFLCQAASGRVLMGINQHQTLAKVTLAEGVANLILSMALVRRYGIIGDALGTAIPLTCTMIFFMPRHLCGKLGLRLGTYLKQAYILPATCCIPLIGTLIALKQWFIPHGRLQLLAQVFIAGVSYGTFVLWAYLTRRVFHLGDLNTRDVAIVEISVPSNS